MNLEKEIKINKILLILLITLSIGTIALRTSHAMFSKKETFNNVLRIITGNELPSRDAIPSLIKKAGTSAEEMQGINPEAGTICEVDCKEYRYTGSRIANNYVQLKNKQTSDGEEVEELWRIIGIFTDEESGEKYMRILRDDVLPEAMIPKNYIANGTMYNIKGGVDAFMNYFGDSYFNGNNNWPATGLQYYLNGEVDTGGNKGYKSYLSAATIGMLEERTHYLGTFIEDTDTTISGYQHERDVKSCARGRGATSNKADFPVSGCNVWDGNEATWNGSISLMYPSDFGFAADKSYWANTAIHDYDVGEIRVTSWIYWSVQNSGKAIWMLSPAIFSSSAMAYLYRSSSVSSGLVGNAMGVRPVLNLSSLVKIKSGMGTKTNPYKLEM